MSESSKIIEKGKRKMKSRKVYHFVEYQHFYMILRFIVQEVLKETKLFQEEI